MESLANAIGVALAAMSPFLQAVVILALSGVGLVYMYRRAGEEAKRERDAAEKAKAGSDSAALGAIKTDVAAVAGKLQDIHTDIQILMDRTPRK